MPAIAATVADVPALRHFVGSATRRQVRLGDEDLAALVEQGYVWLEVNALALRGVTPGGIMAMAAFYPEPRPASLPAGEPDRVFLRAAAFRSGASPSTALRSLVEAWAAATAGATTGARLLIAYGGEAWYNRTLQSAGLALTEQVRFFELPHLQRSLDEQPAGPAAADLRPALAEDLADLATLDAACFDVLWHMGQGDLRQLLLFGAVTLALVDGCLAGYIAITIRDEVAQVARIGVHPAYHRRGIGRQLLLAGLQAAANLGCRSAVLNTQSTNQRAQALYRSFGFHPTEEQFVVYTLRV